MRRPQTFHVTIVASVEAVDANHASSFVLHRLRGHACRHDEESFGAMSIKVQEEPPPGWVPQCVKTYFDNPDPESVRVESAFYPSNPHSQCPGSTFAQARWSPAREDLVELTPATLREWRRIGVTDLAVRVGQRVADFPLSEIAREIEGL